MIGICPAVVIDTSFVVLWIVANIPLFFLVGFAVFGSWQGFRDSIIGNPITETPNRFDEEPPEVYKQGNIWIFLIGCGCILTAEYKWLLS